MKKTIKNSVLISSFFTLSILLSFPTTSYSGGLVIQQDQDFIIAKNPFYSLNIQKAPYALTVIRGDSIVFGHAVPDKTGGSFFVKDGSKFHLKQIETWRSQANDLYLTVATTCNEEKVNVFINCHKDHIDITWRLNSRAIVDQMGENFSLKAAGHWYGGNVTSAHNWPLETGQTRLDPFNAGYNQTAPIWLTSKGTGVFINTCQVMGFSVNDKDDGLFSFNVKNTHQLSYQIIVGDNIVDAYHTFIDFVGKPSVVPPKEYFVDSIFNSWIELKIDVNQQGMLQYARKIRQYDFPCTILMIDDMWQNRYGDQEFNPEKFPDPKKMFDELHQLGFKVALWVVPYIHQDAANYQYAVDNHYLVMGKTGKKPALVKWWNGTTAIIDLSNPQAYSWLLNDLKSLQSRYGVDGFKLDGGDAGRYPADLKSFGNVPPNKATDLFAGMGQHFIINELRVSWLVQNLGLVQRLRDKNSNWSVKSGLRSLIPNGLTESLIGYSYFCPDMIGGGLSSDFENKKFKGMDPELFIRWTQASAMMPMMQFSFAPWNLDEKSINICRDYTKLHRQMGDYIYQLARKFQQTGEPIARPLFFRNPEDEKTYFIQDQFMLGDRFLVAPVQAKGAVSRDVYLPQGVWKDFWSAKIYKGGQTIEDYPAPIEILPIFISITEN